MKRNFSIGEQFTLSSDAIANYGTKYEGKIFTVSQWYDRSSGPSSSHPHGHPGFDESAGSCLYEADNLNFALYEWEMEKI